MTTLLESTDASFEQDVLQATVPVLVDFWAPWCGPCKMLTPILEGLAGEYADRLKMVKINVDEQPDTAPKFGVRGIPTLILFKDGQVLDTSVGALTKEKLVAFLDKHL